MTSIPLAPTGHALTVVLSDETWGVCLLHVSEIVEPTEIAPAAKASAFVSGLMAHHGTSLPVIDLRHNPNAPARVMVVRIRPESEAPLPIGLLVNLNQPPPPVPRGPSKTMPDALRGFSEIKSRVRSLLRLARGVAGDELAAVSANA